MRNSLLYYTTIIQIYLLQLVLDWIYKVYIDDIEIFAEFHWLAIESPLLRPVGKEKVPWENWNKEFLKKVEERLFLDGIDAL